MTNRQMVVQYVIAGQKNTKKAAVKNLQKSKCWLFDTATKKGSEI